MRATRHLTDDERRARLVARHHLARTAPDVVTAVRSIAAQHSSDPTTPFLACWARVRDFAVQHLEAALYDDRTLWRLHAMRRTLFLVPSEDAPLFGAAAARDVAAAERKRLEAWLAPELPPGQVRPWLGAVEAQVRAALADGAELRTQDLTARVPELGLEVTLGSGKWSLRTAVGSRLLFLLAMDGHLARSRPVGSWRASQYRWVAAPTFCGREGPFGAPAPPDPAAARAELVRRYLAGHGPATATDLRWWTGWTAKLATAALHAVDAEAVSLDGGGEGFVLPGDTAPTPPSTGGPVALLPALDSTPMGWKERAWYLGDHTATLYDTNGNVGPTVWWEGRVVGGWAQRPSGEVVWRLLTDVGAEAAARVAAEAAALTAWLDGVVPLPRFATPLERQLSGRTSGGAASD